MIKLRYPYKFLVIAILFLLSLGVVGYFFLSSQYKNITIVEKEKIGVQFEANLALLLNKIPQHKSYAYHF